MAKAAHSKTGEYKRQIKTVEARYAKEIQAVRAQILGDTALPDLDRAVLGLTSSSELLTTYKLFQNTIEKNAGEPILVMGEREKGENEDSFGYLSVGRLTGEIAVRQLQPSGYVSGVRIGARTTLCKSFSTPPSFEPRMDAITIATITPDIEEPGGYSIRDFTEDAYIGWPKIYSLPELSNLAVNNLLSGLSERISERVDVK
jgi:hypothetical protein